MNWIRTASLSALLVGAALAACGPSAKPGRIAADAPEIDSCALLPEAEAIQLAGEDLDPVSTALDHRVHREVAKCSYANLGGPPFRMISLEVRRYPSADAARGVQERALKLLRRVEGEGAETIAGLGDSALWAPRSQQLHLLTGDLRFIITVQLGDPRFRGESAREIATKALDRLTAVPIETPAPPAEPLAPATPSP